MTPESTYTATDLSKGHLPHSSASDLPFSQAALEAMPFPFAICTCDGLYVAANDLIEQLFGAPKATLIGAFNILTDPDAARADMSAAFLAACAGQRGAVPPTACDVAFPGASAPDRMGRWITCSFLPFRDATGRVTHIGMLIEDVTARVEFEQRTLRLTAMIENALDAMGTIDLQGRITYCNAAYLTLTGYGDDLIGRPITTIFADDSATVASAVGQVAAQGQWQGELTARRADGTSFPADVSASPLRDRAGQLIGMAAIVRDLTEHRAREQRLRMFEALVESAAVGMALADLKGVFTYTNAIFRDTYGYGEELVGMSIPMLLPPDVQATHGPGMAALFTTGRAEIETPFVCRDGSIRPTSVAAFLIRGAGGVPIATAALIRDLTDEHARERELRLTKFSLDRLPDNIHWIDPSGTIIYVNDGACSMLGYLRDELIGLTIADIDPLFQAQDWSGIWQQLKERGTMARESAHRRKDGSTFPIDLVASFLEFEGREYACVFTRDISERKQRENELRTFQAIVENTPYGVSIVDFSGRIVYANPAYRAMLGYDHSLVGMSGLDVIAPEDIPLTSSVMEHLPEQRISYLEFRLRRADGDLLPVAGTIFLQEAPDGRQQMIGFTRDLTEQKRAEADRAALQEQVIAAQQAALRELSTPLIPIAEGVVAMPLIGSIDSGRAHLVIETLLHGTAELRAHTTIIDITGVPVVDTEVANAMLRAAQAVKLLGAHVILTGIRPEVAQTLVGLGVDLGGITTRGTLQAGVTEALARGFNEARKGRR